MVLALVAFAAATLTEGPKVIPSVLTSKPAGAVTVTGPVKLAPLSVNVV